MLRKCLFGLIILLLVILLFYTRFVNLSWGLPYPFHPDERNMANAIQRLSIINLFKPDFFAYGQFSLYLGYLIVVISKLIITHTPINDINFNEAIIALRLISATVSILNVIVLLKIIQLIFPKILKQYLLAALLFLIFIPSFIQYSHFGTTESILMFLYSAIIYISLKIFITTNLNKNYFLLALLTGLAIAIKMSSIIFIFIPIFAIIYNLHKINKEQFILSSFFQISKFAAAVLVFTIIFSPYNFISFSDFLGSMKYESDVALGTYMAFYTRQFTYSIPLIFQMIKVFPYVLGWPIYIIFILGFIFLPKNKNINLLRFAFLIFLIPSSFLYAKWTRFVAPIIPLMSLFAFLFIVNLFQSIKTKKIKLLNVSFITILLISIIPGLAFLTVYTSADVRFVASNWIYKNIPNGEFLLYETANVVDVPIPNPLNPNPNRNYPGVSFNYYDIDNDINLKNELENYIQKTNYIIIPSRRVFMNHTCLEEDQNSPLRQGFEGQAKLKSQKLIDLDNYAYFAYRCAALYRQYPNLYKYYNNLFSGSSFQKVAEFSSYPRITLFRKTILEFPDEQAEEGWTVFDHPVIRIYKRI